MTLAERRMLSFQRAAQHRHLGMSIPRTKKVSGCQDLGLSLDLQSLLVAVLPTAKDRRMMASSQ